MTSMHLRRPTMPRADAGTHSIGRGGGASTGGGAERGGLDLAAEMRRRWQAGERAGADELLSAHPELFRQPEAAVEVIYEEYCLRRAAGDADAGTDVLRRFPQWAEPLRVMLECHERVLRCDGDRPQLPGVGDRVGGFVLRAELGHGSRGRVFLAADTRLADRPVVVKVVPLDGRAGGEEHLSLARLQHTNIVPVYSVSDATDRGVRALCMPYFGSATLGTVLRALGAVPPVARTGRHVVDAIDCPHDRPVLKAAPATVAAAGPVRQMLARVSHVQAVTWIAACLADALHFAHERGLVHLDLKPSNVLLAADGQPMLLDFHLACAPVREGGPLPEGFGGTPPYMPPEQRDALEALREGRPAPAAVDRRADVYALGAMLYESLGGTLPVSGASPPLERVNPRVTPGLSDVAAKCLAPRPQDRYADAAALAEDLRRHLTDWPLAGVPNRSFVERWSKWRRRRPGALRLIMTLPVAAASVALVLATAAFVVRDRNFRAQTALADARRQFAAGQFDESIHSCRRGFDLIDRLPFADGLRRELLDHVGATDRRRLGGQLRRLADQSRLLYASDSLPSARRAALAAQYAALWEDRRRLLASPDPSDAGAVASDLKDVAIFAAHLRAAAPGSAPRAGGPDDALRILDEVEAMFGPSKVLDHERSGHRAAAGLAPPAARELAGSGPGAPRGAWEYCAIGRALLAAGRLPEAARELSAALALDPAGRWPNYYYGLCAHRMGRHEEALTAFSVCIGTAPDAADCFYNRALAHAASGRPDRALNDYDRALQLEPEHAAAALNRGVVHFRQSRLDRAAEDFRRALANGADAASAHYNLALVYVVANEPGAAARHLRLALESNPSHSQARELMDAFGAAVSDAAARRM